ncbi:phosphotransferase [Homoserinimonas sp. OAct 916]|uniref:maltokinase N-terminal cap-like domain-containing protein n=1 Tax=Homoserinimonas sp. OAct 916 TaxID=2211450 RepID=UPI000DBE8D32|nr:phosphotransferase [Homoserinimonas sp. OAct 916]
MATAEPIAEALAGWMRRQRWFVGAGGEPSLRIVASVPLPPAGDAEAADVDVAIHFIADETESPAVLYQVPVTGRRVKPEALDHGLIGTVTDDQGHRVHLFDGPEDPAFAHRLLHLIVRGEGVSGDRAQVRGVAVAPWPFENLTSEVLRGEQSNTSIVYTPGGGGRGLPAICKLFRMVHHGDNPDVVLQSALFEAGSHSVPTILGSVAGQWPDPSRPGGRAHGHLAFAQQFLEGAGDAWRLALDAVNDSSDFSVSARQMGVATADIHETLGRVLPTSAATPADIADVIRSWRARFDAAVREVPELETFRGPIEHLYEKARVLPWPSLQRIHGDLHLGQILALADGTWVIIDFEGEPMRALAERSLPDVPLRDIAGMLRSFDYAAASGPGHTEHADWARSCRMAFLDGYAWRSGWDIDDDRLLLDAFEVDKALYEVVYEARNRPDWLAIPVSALRRLAAGVDDAH